MTTSNDFKGRTALITGAASGIGRACAEALAKHGAARLILNDLDQARLETLELGGCEIDYVIGSVADEAMWEAAGPKLVGLTHAVVNAGIGAAGQIRELPFAEWRRVMDVNLDGVFLTLKAALSAIKQTASQTGGSIVITSSSTALKAIPGTGPYGASKAAVAHLARIAALEAAPDNIRVNAIAPGGVDTAIWESSDDFNRSVAAQGRDATLKAMAKTTPSGRFATSQEIAETMLFMLSDAASNMTGHVLVSDGAFTL
ncbi:MAG: SDR family oxidoreductase [Pseudomonadota bacterium]